MRRPRLKLQGRSAVYHCMSRLVGAEPLLDPLGREHLVRLLYQLARFSGVQLLTYCVLSNHFHVLVRVPEGAEVSDAELLARLEALHGSRSPLVQSAREAWERQGRLPGDLRRRLQARLGDVSVFMQEVKQRFTRWYNRRNERRGTLWAERFKSVLVEDQPGAVGTVAAYIDLNAVRAGLVDDPKDYRFCGYAAAVAGAEVIRAGLRSFHPGAGSWREVAAAYRQRLFVKAGRGTRSAQAVLEREQIKRVWREGGQLSEAQVLRLRLRHLTDGLVLGSQEFVEEMFRQYRQWFGRRRRSGARPIRGVPLAGLRVLRDLRVRAVT